MNLVDCLLIGALGVAIVLAIFRIRNARKKGGCCGDCSSCGGCGK